MPRSAPISAQESPGNSMTGALWNAQVKSLIDFITAPPAFKGYATLTQSIPNGTFTSLTLDAESWDSDNGHSTTSATSRYVCQVPGVYSISAGVAFAANATGGRGLQVTVNGTPVTGAEILEAATASGSWSGSETVDARLASGDYVEIQAYQSITGGGALATNVGATALLPTMSLHWISA
ncbi:hypothetical protein ACIQGZ_16925 [Streptomyces sp. NPDC092296]|uniref:hypothetical protein n=1 Tax=Streptomyces sp. NPDC092296 TaxID=3366012 RepID=UPI0038109FE5